MKTKLLFLGLLITLYGSVFSQTINNQDFSTVSNWTLMGSNDLSMVDLSAIHNGVNQSLILISNTTAVSNPVGTTNQNPASTEGFILKSEPFRLLSNIPYEINLAAGYFYYPNNSQAQEIGVPGNIVVKDSNNNIVADLSMSYSNPGNTTGFLNETSLFVYENFIVPTSEEYTIEISGQVQETWLDLHYPTIHDTYAFIFDSVRVIQQAASPQEVKGKVTYDSGNNNCASSSTSLTNIQLKSTGTNGAYYSTTNNNGDYVFGFNENGTVTTGIATPGLSFTSITNIFTIGVQSTVNNQNFCVTSTTTGDDVSVLVIPTSEARPGFKSRYRIQYTNTGSTTVSGDVVLNFEDTKMHSPVATPSENSSTSNSLTWNYTGLQPFETRIIDVEFTNNTPTQNPNPLNGGDILNFTANITPLTSDVNQADNSFTLVQPVVNSYDPNDATILEGPQVTQQQATQDLHFRLRFQNTGTASAININVKTMLDADLDWVTFTPIAASHSYNTSLNSTTGEVNFSFPNINLADSTSNEPASHGWVLFKAKPKSSFAVGDTIDCGADIFFDYNPPITTNVAQTQIYVPTNNYTAIPDMAFEKALIDLGHDNMIDGQVLTANISGLTSLDVSDPLNNGNLPNVTAKITDLTGIEDFTALEILKVSENDLSSINVSSNVNLKELWVNSNRLTSIDITSNVLLEVFYLISNQVTTIDLSQNVVLKELYVTSNLLATIDVSKNINLIRLNCSNNQIKVLDVSKNLSLTHLNTHVNLIESIDVSVNTNLRLLQCNNNNLKALNIANGNNTNMGLWAYANANLTCIQSDSNSGPPAGNNVQIDSQTSFNTDCNYLTSSVPDSVFENYLETHDRDGNVVSLGDVTSMGNGIANDQKVFTYRICNVIQLDVSGKSIGVLTGIEDFRDLEVFGFLGGSSTITNMDLSNNTKLKRIHSGLLSNLSTITLGSLPNLTFLQFGYDKVTNIDISGLPNLDDLRVLSGKVTSLSTINNLKLKSLAISSPIKHLNVSSNAVLETLSVGSDLETLNIANGNNNNLNLSIQNNSNLTCITADAGIPTNGLSNWNIDSQHTFSGTLCSNSLTYVPDGDFENYLETHDANGNVVALGANNSMGNGVANDNFVFTNRINTVTQLDVNSKSISNLKGVEDFTALEELIAWANNLSSLNVTQNTALKKLNFFANNITNIDLSNNTQLTHLDCSQNSLMSLNVADLTSLESLVCGGNSFTNIDISQNINLTDLSCSGLSTLDFTNNLKLKNLGLGNINITTLDTSILTDLELISISGMQVLKSVDISQNLKINSIGIESNPEIISLNINNTQNTIITYFNSYNNSKLTCIQVDDVTYANSNWGSDKDNHTSFNTDCSSVWTVNVSSSTLTALLAITPSIDTNRDGEITLAEAAAYTNPIDFSGQNLTSVEGLQAFTNVTQIDLQNNSITDFSPLTDASIPYINKSNGKTKIVSRTGAFNLEELNISNNTGVQSLDVSKLTKLKKLTIKDNPDLITVNLKNGNNTAITDFDSSNTPKLTCILVDDINANYLANWTKDDANTFVADEADCRSRVLSVTQENLQEYISLYPNPIKDFITVKLSNQLELKNIKIINLLGKEILNKKQEKVNLSNLPSGIYLLKVTTDKGIITKKIIKE